MLNQQVLTLLYRDIILDCVVLLNIKQMQPEEHVHTEAWEAQPRMNVK